jgi:TRAP transporter 4TM/12TM fusion protein
LYLTSQGIFGIPVQVVSTFVFHFVLFGILANEIGLGKFFIDFAYCIAGRQTGGTAKVSVLASAFFGTISGSSIANTVTTGSLTIPAMKSAGFKKHFAAAVEAASSTGGQITPPMMGAAAFIMAEMLEIPYLTIMCAAIIPALLHYIGVFTMIHLESKKLNIGRIAENKIPKFKELIKKQYLKLIPIVILITTLLLGYTPYKACFYGITSCLIIGFLQKENKLNFKKVYNSFILGSKFAISVGVVAAAVGIIIGVVTMTGTAFKISYTAAVLGNNFILYLQSVIPFIDVQSSKLFITGIIVSFCCIFLGAGIPTTATYIIVATIAAPVLSEIGVLPLVAHFFVFYYGVIADITPPVAVAAYAGAGIAGADPIKTGNTAFMLSTGKIIVPFFFLFSPSLLIFVDNFSFAEFITAFVTCITSIVLISISFIGYLNKKISIGSRIFFFILGIVLIFL